MATLKTNDINRLVGEFMTLYELWEDHPPSFSWDALRTLATDGAQAYNEGYGPSFHILAFDGYPQGEFHERFLAYLLDAGFDPFRTVAAASGGNYIAVFGHDGLAEAARDNPIAARMQASLYAIARQRYAGAAAVMISADELERIVLHCHDSIPDDVLADIAPAFVSAMLA